MIKLVNGVPVDLSPAEIAQVQADQAAAAVAPVPDGPTLSDWRVALVLMERFDDVQAAVIAARDGGTVDGKIAWQRFEYANNVYRAELLQLAPLFGFTEAEIDQSLWLAAQVAAGAP